MHRTVLMTMIVATGLLANSSTCAMAGGTVGEYLVYRHGPTVYCARYEAGRVDITAMSTSNESVLSFAVDRDDLLLLLQARPTSGADAVVTERRGWLQLTIMSASALPGLEADGPIAFSGRTVAYVGRRGKEYSLNVFDLVTRNSRALVRANDELVAPAVSPDGRHVAFYAASGSGRERGLAVRIVSVDTGDVRQVAAVSRVAGFGGDPREPPIWSPDGRSLVVYAWYGGGDRQGAYVVAASGEGEPRFMGTGLCTAIDHERAIGYVVHDGVYAVGLEGPEVQRRLVVPRAWWPRVSADGRLLAYMKSDALYIKELKADNEVLVVEKWRNSGQGSAWIAGALP